MTTPAGQVGPVVRIDLDTAGTRALATLTRAAVADRRSLLLLTPGSRTPITAPTVEEPILGGSLQIAGLGGRPRAERIVSLITSDGG